VQHPQNLHQRLGLPGQVVGPAVLVDGELGRNHTGDQSTGVPVDLVALGARLDERDQNAGIEDLHPHRAGGQGLLYVACRAADFAP